MAILFGFHGNIKFQKRDFLNDISSKTTEAVWLILYKCCLGKDNSK